MGIRIEVGVDYVRSGMEKLKGDLGSVGKIALGTMAGQLGMEALHKSMDLVTDSMRTAADEQALYTASAQNLANAGLGKATKSVQDWFTQNSLTTGFMKADVVPAFDRMVRSTHNVKEAVGAVTLAENIARATHKDLGTVTAALGKTYDGNKVALGRLGLGHDALIIKQKGLRAGLQAMSKEFGGQASKYADTYAGKLDRVKVAAGEVKKGLGEGIMQALDTVAKSFVGTGTKAGDFGQKVKAIGLFAGAFGAGMVALGVGIGGLIIGTVSIVAKAVGGVLAIMSFFSKGMSHLPIVGGLFATAHKFIEGAHQAVTGFGNSTWNAASGAEKLASKLGKLGSSLGKQGQDAWNAKGKNDGLTGSLAGTGGSDNSKTPNNKGKHSVASGANAAAAALKNLESAIQSAASGAITTLADKFTAAADKAKNLFDQVRGLFNMGNVQRGTDIIATMSGSVAQSTAFNAAIKQLKKKGLNKQSLSELLAAGPSSLAAAQNLLNQGPGAIHTVNVLEGKLLASANTYSNNYGSTDGAGYGSTVNGLLANAKAASTTHYHVEKGAITITVGAGADPATAKYIAAQVNAALMKAMGGRSVNKNVNVKG